MDKNGMDGGQLSTNPQIHTNLLVKADINPEAYRQRGGMRGGETTGRWWERTLIGALTREGADANEDICGCLTSLHHLMP